MAVNYRRFEKKLRVFKGFRKKTEIKVQENLDLEERGSCESDHELKTHS